MNEEEKRIEFEFETKMCELIRNCTFRITEARVLTYYANSYYILLLDQEMPVAIVEYYVNVEKDTIWFHNYHPMERSICVDMLVALESIERKLTSALKEIKGELE